MRRTRQAATWLGIVGGLVVAIALVAMPAGAQPGAHDGAQVTEDNDSDGTPNNIADAGDNAHPSGRDRSVEHGRSGIQGRSGSNPDGGAVDKPGGDGGVDRLDQDGNNGCGNDDDFEDDNNGNCGHEEAPAGQAEVGTQRFAADRRAAPKHQAALDDQTDVRAPAASTTAAVRDFGSPEPSGSTRVLGVTYTRALDSDVVAAASVGGGVPAAPVGTDQSFLARTGTHVAQLLAAALTALVAGALVLQLRRRWRPAMG